jgi:hypothetical protein
MAHSLNMFITIFTVLSGVLNVNGALTDLIRSKL